MVSWNHWKIMEAFNILKHKNCLSLFKRYVSIKKKRLMLFT
jgi:hypothetical protein